MKIRGRENKTNYQIAKETNQANFELSKYSFEQNKQMADTEWQRNLEQWNRQNEYNSPASQMSRYREAGLNPNLIYGQGTPGNASSSPSYSAPEYKAPTMQKATMQNTTIPMLQMLQQSIHQSADFLRTRSEIAKNQEQTNLMRTQQSYINNQSRAVAADILLKGDRHIRNTFENQFLGSTLENRIATENLGLDYRRSMIYSNETRADLNKVMKDLAPYQQQQLVASINNLQQTFDINAFRFDLERIGVNPNDSTLMRIGARALLWGLKHFGIDLGEITQGNFDSILESFK